MSSIFVINSEIAFEAEETAVYVITRDPKTGVVQHTRKLRECGNADEAFRAARTARGAFETARACQLSPEDGARVFKALFK